MSIFGQNSGGIFNGITQVGFDDTVSKLNINNIGGDQFQFEILTTGGNKVSNVLDLAGIAGNPFDQVLDTSSNVNFNSINVVDKATTRTNLGLGALSVKNNVDLASGDTTGNLANNRVSGLGSLALKNSVDLATGDATGNLANTRVSGLGTMSTQNDSAVAITGGSINNVSLSTNAVLTNSIDSVGNTLSIGTSNNTTTMTIGGTKIETINIGTAGSGNSTINIGGAGDNIIVAGNLITVNTTNLDVADKNIQLNSGAVGSAVARGSGLNIRDSNNNEAGYIRVNQTNGQTIEMKSPENAFVLSTPVLTATDTITINGDFTNTNTIYVSKNGNDSNAGTINKPVLTIQQAITLASSTNNVYTSIFINPGTYTETLTCSKSRVHLVGNTGNESYRPGGVILNGSISYNITNANSGTTNEINSINNINIVCQSTSTSAIIFGGNSASQLVVRNVNINYASSPQTVSAIVFSNSNVNARLSMISTSANGNTTQPVLSQTSVGSMWFMTQSDLTNNGSGPAYTISAGSILNINQSQFTSVGGVSFVAQTGSSFGTFSNCSLLGFSNVVSIGASVGTQTSPVAFFECYLINTNSLASGNCMTLSGASGSVSYGSLVQCVLVNVLGTTILGSNSSFNFVYLSMNSYSASKSSSGFTTIQLSNDLPFTNSQWTTSGSDIYYTSGNVGINKIAPSHPLDITGTARATSLIADSLNPQGTTLTLGDSGTTSNINIGTGATVNTIALGTASDTVSIKGLTVGNILNQNVPSSGIVKSDGTNLSSVSKINISDVSGFGMVITDASSFGINVLPQQISNTGQASLHAQYYDRAKIVVASTIGNPANPAISFENGDEFGSLVFGGGAPGSGGFGGFVQYPASVVALADSNISTGGGQNQNVSSRLEFRTQNAANLTNNTANPTTKMTITSGGLVGINKTPSYFLDVSGDANINSGCFYRVNGVGQNLNTYINNSTPNNLASATYSTMLGGGTNTDYGITTTYVSSGAVQGFRFTVPAEGTYQIQFYFQVSVAGGASIDRLGIGLLNTSGGVSYNSDEYVSGSPSTITKSMSLTVRLANASQWFPALYVRSNNNSAVSFVGGWQAFINKIQ